MSSIAVTGAVQNLQEKEKAKKKTKTNQNRC
jgi:hypothetical protein